MCGCAREKPVYEEVAQNAVDTVTAIEQGLPTECKTDSNKLLFNIARNEIVNITRSCDEAVNKVEKEKIKWKYSFLGLILIIGVYITRKILK